VKRWFTPTPRQAARAQHLGFEGHHVVGRLTGGSECTAMSVSALAV